LKGNLKKEINGMDKERNIIMMENYYLRVNLKMENNGMDKEKNIIIMEN